MERAKKIFSEFKSIFFTEDLLQENEKHANIVTATTMFNLFLISIVTYVLVFYNFFKLGTDVMNVIVFRGFLLLFIPAIICFVLHGDKVWIKQMLFICFTIMLAMADSILKYNVTLIMVLPVILASRYYSKNFTIGVSIITIIVFAISVSMSIKIGPQDINSYNLVIPNHTVIEIDSTLREAISNVDVDEKTRLANIYIHFFLPKCFIYFLVSFACAQISQSGKKMIIKQGEISEKNARINTELNLASSIQKHMLPSTFPPFPEHDEIDIYASMTPAKEIGGDFYDMFMIDDHRLALCIADVSGKGIPAALFMMISKIAIKNVAKANLEIQQIFERVNNLLCEGNSEDFFITSWLGIIDLNDGKLEFVNAGHNPPLLYSKEKKQYEYLKTEPNLIMGSMENMQYDKHEIILDRGDKLFLYTDGIVEALNENGKTYGEKRLQDFLNNNYNLNAKELICSLQNDIQMFAGSTSQFDDITMLNFCYQESSEKKPIERVFPAAIDELETVEDFINSEMKQMGIHINNILQMHLVVEEVFVNIAKYAYPETEGDCSIQLSIDGDNQFKCIFKDHGVRFNPLERKNPKLDASIEEREVGGLGIYMLKGIVDSIDYRYEDQMNVLTITKKLVKKENVYGKNN